jgi:hypothetical protein
MPSPPRIEATLSELFTEFPNRQIPNGGERWLTGKRELRASQTNIWLLFEDQPQLQPTNAPLPCCCGFAVVEKASSVNAAISNPQNPPGRETFDVETPNPANKMVRKLVISLVFMALKARKTLKRCNFKRWNERLIAGEKKSSTKELLLLFIKEKLSGSGEPPASLVGQTPHGKGIETRPDHCRTLGQRSGTLRHWHLQPSATTLLWKSSGRKLRS